MGKCDVTKCYAAFAILEQERYHRDERSDRTDHREQASAATTIAVMAMPATSHVMMMMVHGRSMMHSAAHWGSVGMTAKSGAAGASVMSVGASVMSAGAAKAAGTETAQITAGVGHLDTVHIHMVGFTLSKGRMGQNQAAETPAVGAVIFKGENFRTVFFGDSHLAAGFLLPGKLQIHGDLPGITFGPVHGRAHGDDGAAVDKGTQIGV